MKTRPWGTSKVGDSVFLGILEGVGDWGFLLPGRPSSSWGFLSSDRPSLSWVSWCLIVLPCPGVSCCLIVFPRPWVSYSLVVLLRPGVSCRLVVLRRPGLAALAMTTGTRWLTPRCSVGQQGFWVTFVIDGSCHKYHFCRDKTRIYVFCRHKLFLSQQNFCRDKHAFVATV